MEEEGEIRLNLALIVTILKLKHKEHPTAVLQLSDLSEELQKFILHTEIPKKIREKPHGNGHDNIGKLFDLIKEYFKNDHPSIELGEKLLSKIGNDKTGGKKSRKNKKRTRKTRRRRFWGKKMI
jgi:hypothetical protein